MPVGKSPAGCFDALFCLDIQKSWREPANAENHPDEVVFSRRCGAFPLPLTPTFTLTFTLTVTLTLTLTLTFTLTFTLTAKLWRF